MIDKSIEKDLVGGWGDDVLDRKERKRDNLEIRERALLNWIVLVVVELDNMLGLSNTYAIASVTNCNCSDFSDIAWQHCLCCSTGNLYE